MGCEKINLASVSHDAAYFELSPLESVRSRFCREESRIRRLWAFCKEGQWVWGWEKSGQDSVMGEKF